MSDGTRQEDRTNAGAAISKLDDAVAVLDKVLDTSKSVDPTTRAGHPLNSLIVQARGHIVEAQTRLGDIVKR